MSTDALPEVGDVVPKVLGTLIEDFSDGVKRLYLRIDFVRSNLKSLPTHDIVRFGFRLYHVHEYHQIIDAFRVTEFRAILSEDDLARLADGD